MNEYLVYAYNPKNCTDKLRCKIKTNNINNIESEFYKIYNEKYKIINIFREGIEYGN